MSTPCEYTLVEKPIIELLTQRDEAEARMTGFLKELGYGD
jgi:hypothetical protein